MDKTLITELEKKDILLGTAQPTPIIIELQLSYTCNANCIMCDMDIREKNKELSTNQILSLINELKKLNTKMIILTGGEPFLRNDLSKIIQQCNKKNILVSIHTNGTLINKPTINKLKTLKVHSINVSFHHPSNKQDSINNIEGSFNKILNAINLIKKGLPDTHIKLRCVLTTQNYGKIKDFQQLYDWAHFDSLKFIFARPLESTNNLKIFLNTIQKEISLKNIEKLKNNAPFIVKEPRTTFKSPVTCLSSLFRATITPTGNVIPSCYCENKIMGNINDELFTQIWLGTKANKIRQSCCHDCEQSLNQELNFKYNNQWKKELGKE